LGDNLASNISLAELARHCELSPSHFSRAFKVSTGCSPFAWLQQHRLDRAKDLLRGGRTGLAEIAFLCGYADQSHFSRMFSRHAGITPGAWQRANRTAQALPMQQ
jgi:transcriptional regulator GlxA family with amidase domain